MFMTNMHLHIDQYVIYVYKGCAQIVRYCTNTHLTIVNRFSNIIHVQCTGNLSLDYFSSLIYAHIVFLQICPNNTQCLLLYLHLSFKKKYELIVNNKKVTKLLFNVHQYVYIIDIRNI